MMRAIGLGALLLASCATPTELVVVTDSDLAVPGEIDAIALEIVGPGGDRHTRQASLVGRSAQRLPLTAVLLYQGGAFGPVAIRVRGRREGAGVVQRDANAWFVPGRSVLVPIHLERACRSVPCPGGTTCVDGACVDPPGQADAGTDAGPALVDAGTDAGLGLVDAGSDAGPGLVDAGTDAGAPPVVDAGPPPCRAGCECEQSCERSCRCRGGCDCDLACPPGEECSSRCSDHAICRVWAQGASELEHTCEDGALCEIDAREVSEIEAIVCRSGAYCRVDCGGASNCDVECEDGARCEVDCAGASDCDVECKGGSQCHVDCAGASNCELECRNESSCVADCTDTSDCRISECREHRERELHHCAGDVLACAADCPS